MVFSEVFYHLRMKHHNVTFFAVSVFSLLLIASPQVARADLALGAFGGWGTLSDSSAAVPSVKATTLGAYVVPSFSVVPFLNLGAYGEYHVVGQRTKPADVSNYDKAFSGYLAGGALIIDAKVFRLTGAYTFHGEGKLKNKTSTGSSETLKNPKGMHVILGISILPILSLDFGYAKVKYDVMVNGASQSRTRDWKDYRVGASLNF